MEREVKVRGLLVDPTTNSPVVLLRDIQAESILPIWVGSFEATSIASEIEKRLPQRPMPHDLLKNVITQMGCVVEKVVITDLRESTFYATIQLKTHRHQSVIIDSRPSDAIALALRCDSPIFVRNHVFESSKLEEQVGADHSEDPADEISWPEEIGEV